MNTVFKKEDMTEMAKTISISEFSSAITRLLFSFIKKGQEAEDAGFQFKDLLLQSKGSKGVISSIGKMVEHSVVGL